MSSGRTGIQIPSSLTVKARPELGGVDSNTFNSCSATSEEQDDLEKAVSTVGLLKDAIQLQHDVDHHFISEKIVTKENPSIPSLELSLLNVAANEFTDGVFYYLVVQFKKHYLVRYVESGCYEGLMERSGLTQLAKLLKVSEDQLLPYQIYGRNEIEKQKVKTAESSKRNSLKRKRDENSSRVTRGSRHDKQFIRLMVNNMHSVVTQANLVKKVIHETHPNNFPSGFVHVLRKNQTPGNPYHRFMDVLQLQPDVSTCGEWDKICTKFISEGHIPKPVKCTKELLLDKYNGPLELKEQFGIICSFSNFHWDPCIRLDALISLPQHPCILQHLSYPVESAKEPLASSDLSAYAAQHYPASFRNRIIHFSFENKKQYIRNCIKKVVLESQIEETSQHTTSLDDIPQTHGHWKYTPRVVKVTPEMSGISNKSYHQTRCMYTQYKESLITGGTISIRVKTNETSIYLLNNYSLDNGQMLKNSFVHLTVMKESQPHTIHCTCDAYSFLQSEFQTRSEPEILMDPTTSCWHATFYREHICNSAAEKGNMTQLQNKQSFSDNTNVLVEVVGRAVAGTPALFSVRGTSSHSNNCSFVNLSRTGRWIVCQSRSCQAESQNRRRVPSILSLDSDQSHKLCEHLQAMKAQREVWQHLCREDIKDDGEEVDSDEEDVDDDDDDVSEAFPSELINRDDADILRNLDIPLSFNKDTGLWNFGGLSTHKPNPEYDANLTKSVLQRLAMGAVNEHNRDEEKYILGFNLEPAVPNTCPCKAGYDTKSGATLEKDYQTKLYTKNGPLRCWVYKRVCADGTCVHRYSGEEHCIHQYSRDVCAGDEIGWDFVRNVTNVKTSFSAYVYCKTADYRDSNVLSASFMSTTTFIKWWFSWAASLAIDFRKASIDPVCKRKPQILKANGTHVGGSVSQMNFTPIEFYMQFFNHLCNEKKKAQVNTKREIVFSDLMK